MRQRRVASALVVAAALAAQASVPACSSNDNTPSSIREGGAEPGDGGRAFIDGSVLFPDANVGDGGALDIVDVADTPCAAPGSAARDVYAAGATTFRPLRLSAVGARLAMQVDDGFVVMDADGANPSPQMIAAPFPIVAVGSSPDTLFALGGNSPLLQAARFDAAGAVLGSAVDVAVPSGASAVGGGEGTALAVFLKGFELQARAFSADGAPVAPAFTFRNGLAEIQATKLDVVHAGGAEYGVAFAGQSTAGHRLVFTRVSTSARVGTSFTLIVGPRALRLVQVARAGKGFAVLVERATDLGPPETLVVLLDAAGRVAAPTLRLLGVRQAFGLASSGDELGVLAWRARAGTDPDEPDPDAIEFRPFAASGAPLGPWVCLGAPFPTPTVDVGAAILGDDAGYRVLMRTPTQAVSFSRFNRLGTGS